MVDTLLPGRTLDPGPQRGRHTSSAACLIVAFDAAQPLVAPSRHWLVDVDEVALGRSSNKDRAWARATEDARAVLRLRLPDALVSAKHTVLRREPTGWIIEDAGSRNGTLVNGRTINVAKLASGDVITLGGTFLVYREGPLDATTAPLDATADDPAVASLPAGVQTMSPVLEAMFDKVVKIARGKSSVVILGDTGTGKEQLARAIHSLSGRPGALVAVNCAAVPATLIESELFGHKVGAFSGATSDREGLVTASHNGTLFLDEIGELPMPAQAALLRVLQDEQVRPLGATASRAVDLRVVAATNVDLPELVRDKQFRADLWARLAGFIVELPGLHDRREDLGLMIRALLPKYTRKPVVLTPAAAARVFAYGWPLNIRELEKALESATTLADHTIDVPELPEAVTETAPGPLSDDDQLRQRLTRLLREHAGNLADVGRAMGKARQQIQRWCKRLGIDPQQFRAQSPPK
ncbi:MAG: sigma 54-interacting transcriptional regulator [Kofleriaceae bacterium]